VDWSKIDLPELRLVTRNEERYSCLALPLEGTPTNNCTKLRLYRQTRVPGLHFYRWQCMHNDIFMFTLLSVKVTTYKREKYRRENMVIQGHWRSFIISGSVESQRGTTRPYNNFGVIFEDSEDLSTETTVQKWPFRTIYSHLTPPL